jgi:hypothetical protein
MLSAITSSSARMIGYIEVGDDATAGAAKENHFMRVYRHVMQPETAVFV